MSEIVMLEGQESHTVLETVTESRAPAIMSYLSKGKWHVAKVLMRELTGNRLYVEGCRPSKRLIDSLRFSGVIRPSICSLVTAAITAWLNWLGTMPNGSTVRSFTHGINDPGSSARLGI